MGAASPVRAGRMHVVMVGLRAPVGSSKTIRRHAEPQNDTERTDDRLGELSRLVSPDASGRSQSVLSDSAIVLGRVQWGVRLNFTERDEVFSCAVRVDPGEAMANWVAG